MGKQGTVRVVVMGQRLFSFHGEETRFTNETAQVISIYMSGDELSAMPSVTSTVAS